MKHILLAIALIFLAGCKSENLDAQNIASKSNISQAEIEKAQHFDKASYKGLEHIFKDTGRIASDGKFVLLIFGKNGCQWCERLKEEIGENKQTQEMLQKDFQTYYINLSYSKIHQLDFDGKKSQAETSRLAREYDIRPTPTSIFIDPQGNVIFGWPGYFSQKQMQVILQFIANKEYKQFKDPKEFFAALSAKLKEVE
ncbi:thioredoxin family protein [Helicobacter pametensis]|uniref:thioredoxin family protein n=1 Tax=Helicobacter pametensis TaxID=95149 RepID=UPI0004AF9B10|nr:thioredoxin fold domain-containing protein [Helicobacter pametensis]